MAFDPPELPDDVDVVTDAILDGMATAMPGWVPVEGAPEVALAEEVGRETALLRTTAIETLAYAVGAFGQTVFGIPVDDGNRATMNVTLTVTGAGVEVPAGFTVTGTTDLGVDVAFELPAPLISTGTALPAVFEALEVGAAYNGVPAGPLQIATSSADVSAATSTTASAGGSEPESQDVYLDRLVDYISTLRPGGVQAADLEALARSVDGVQRALAYDLYDSNTATSGVEKTVSISALDAAGAPVAGAVLTALNATLAASREVNFVIRTASPTITGVNVAVAAIAEPGFVPADVDAGITAALEDYLSPATWGTVGDDPESWKETLVLRYLDVAAVVGAVPGVASVTSLTLDGGTTDLTYTGKWRLLDFVDAGIVVT